MSYTLDSLLVLGYEDNYDYGVAEEGVLSSIGNAIKNVFTKIGELIKRFVNWIKNFFREKLGIGKKKAEMKARIEVLEKQLKDTEEKLATTEKMNSEERKNTNAQLYNEFARNGEISAQLDLAKMDLRMAKTENESLVNKVALLEAKVKSVEGEKGSVEEKYKALKEDYEKKMHSKADLQRKLRELQSRVGHAARATKGEWCYACHFGYERIWNRLKNNPTKWKNLIVKMLDNPSEDDEDEIKDMIQDTRSINGASELSSVLSDYNINGRSQGITDGRNKFTTDSDRLIALNSSDVMSFVNKWEDLAKYVNSIMPKLERILQQENNKVDNYIRRNVSHIAPAINKCVALSHRFFAEEIIMAPKAFCKG